ncbi:TonB-dependent siderophore receptor [Terrihabitans sp. B22-R8]|uniref:TonB-dependent siderophore receptor n=1 Tax=Terrihabitans sp. B22-R8 TaxID=3425128 RepID=UPI00403CE682
MRNAESRLPAGMPAGPARWFVTSCVLALGAATPGFAQEAAPDAMEIALEVIEVGGGDDEKADTYAADQASVASRLPMSIRETPQSVSVVTRRRLDDELLFSDADALARTTGVNVSGSPHAQFISSRGFSTLNNVDGLRIMSEDGNFTPVIDAFLLERIEVLRGPAGLLEGAGEPGGVANRRLKRPIQGFGAEASLTYGSHDFRRAEFDIAAPVAADGDVRGRFAAALTDRDFFYDVADQQKIALLGSLEADLGDATIARVTAIYQKDDRTPFWGLPADTDDRLIDLDRSTFLGSRFGRFNVDYLLVTGEVIHEFTSGLKARIAGSHFSQKLDNADLMLFPGADRDTGEYFTSLNVNRDSETGQNLDASLSGSFNLFGRQHDATLGASLIRSNLKVDERWGYDEFPDNIYDPNPNLPVPGSADDGIRQDRDYLQYGVYGQLNAKLTDALTGIVGGRLNWASLQSDMTGPFIQDYEEKAFATPLLGLVYTINPALSVYASYADIFEPQFQRDRAGAALPPMTGTQYEAGIKGALLDGRLQATFAMFDITRNNEAFLVDRGPPRAFETDGETKSQGFEVELTGRVTDAWKVFAGYTFTDYEVTESRDASRVGLTSANTPRHKFSFWTSYDLQHPRLRGLTLGAGGMAVSHFVDFSNAVRAPGYLRLDAAVSYSVTDQVDLSLKVSNLLDAEYYETLATSGHYYGEPRSVLVQLKARL